MTLFGRLAEKLSWRALDLTASRPSVERPPTAAIANFWQNGPEPIALLIGSVPQHRSGACPETCDYCLFLYNGPDSMSTAIGFCRFPEKPTGASPSERLQFHGPPSMKTPALRYPLDPKIQGWRGPRGPRLPVGGPRRGTGRYPRVGGYPAVHGRVPYTLGTPVRHPPSQHVATVTGMLWHACHV